MNIIITGGAGSLGKAFCKLLNKHDLTIIDNNEWAVAALAQEFPHINIQLKDFEKWNYNQTPCDLVIHCAAYKHINLGEQNPHDFIDNNITKTAKLFAECYKFNTDLLFISSDKAVEPISLYGYTKAIGEKLCYHYNGQVARLGNILCSNGSVIPVWEQAIAEQKPIKITDMAMSRYVIEVDDAVKQIWNGYQKGEKLIIPKMRKVFLVNLINEVLQKHGYKSIDDYKPGYELIGKRPGEKIEEKLRWPNE